MTQHSHADGSGGMGERGPFFVTAVAVVVGVVLLATVAIVVGALRPRVPPSPVPPTSPTASAVTSVASSPTPSLTPTLAPSPTCAPDPGHAKSWSCTFAQKAQQDEVKRQEAAAVKVIQDGLRVTYAILAEAKPSTKEQIRHRLSVYYVPPQLDEVVQVLVDTQREGTRVSGQPTAGLRSIKWITEWTPRGGSELTANLCVDGRKVRWLPRGKVSYPGIFQQYAARMINIDGAWKLQQETGHREVARCGG